MKIERAFYLVICLLFAGCVSAPVAYDSTKKTGHWESKVLVKDLRESKSNYVNIDFYAIQPDRLRAEVSATLGVSVASLAIDKNQITYAVHTQKKFYQGALSDRSIEPLLKVRMNPKILFYVLFDRPLPSPQWVCRLTSSGLPEQCDLSGHDYSVVWSERANENKRITIRSSTFEIQIVVKAFSGTLPTKVQKDPNFFTVTAPESYKSYQLQ